MVPKSGRNKSRMPQWLFKFEEVTNLSIIAKASRKSAIVVLQPGDHVEVFQGEQASVHGVVDLISPDVVTIIAVGVDIDGQKADLPVRSVCKRFKPGDHIKVMTGQNADETGLVVSVADNVVTFLSDMSMQEVSHTWTQTTKQITHQIVPLRLLSFQRTCEKPQKSPQLLTLLVSMNCMIWFSLSKSPSAPSFPPLNSICSTQTVGVISMTEGDLSVFLIRMDRSALFSLTRFPCVGILQEPLPLTLRGMNCILMTT